MSNNHNGCVFFIVLNFLVFISFKKKRKPECESLFIILGAVMAPDDKAVIPPTATP
ncbi:Hypothetical protein AKI40_3763 [Enterobacter sp. FY-07]|nr:Hypothetical protein AKI40_3763 [Enterobacter sp. FY-07]